MFKSLLRFIKQSVIYGIGHVLGRFLVVLLLPFHTNLIPKDDYGIATLLFTFIAFAAILYSYGLNVSFLQFYLIETDLQKRKLYFSTAFYATMLSSIILSLIIWIFSKPLSQIFFDSAQFSFLFSISIGILSSDALILLVNNLLRAEERSISFVVFSLLNTFINYIFNIVFVVKLQFGMKGIFYANLLSSFITLLCLLFIAIPRFVPAISFNYFKRMLLFGLPFIPSLLSVSTMKLIDRFFIKFFLGLEATGTYGAGYRLALVINLFILAFQYAWQPFFTTTSKQTDAKEIFSKILTYFALVSSLIFLLFTMYLNDIINFRIFGYTFLGKDYGDSTFIVPIIILGYICNGFYLNFLVGIYLKEKTKYLVYITGSGAIINVIGNFILIPTLGIIGAAYSTLISFLAMSIIIYFIAQKFYPIHYEFNRILKIGISTVIIYCIFSFFQLPYESIANLILIILYFGILYVLRFFEHAELNKFRQIINRFIGQKLSQNNGTE